MCLSVSFVAMAALCLSVTFDAMAECKKRIKTFLKLEQEQEDDMDDGSDTFVERAEWFFKKHPQVLSLLHDLYNGYIALLDRCTKMEGKHKRHSSLISSSTATAIYPDEEIIDTWDVESSLSYQRTPIKAVATLQGSSANQLPSKQLLLFKEDVSFLPIHILVSIIEGFVTVFVC